MRQRSEPFTAPFKAGDILGLLRKANPRLDGFDSMLFQRRLFAIYGDVGLSLGDALQVGPDAEVAANLNTLLRPEVQAALTIFTDIQEFCAIAPRVVEFDGAGFDWPTVKAAPDEVDRAFRYWLEDAALRAVLEAAAEELENPNGTEAGEVTPAQAADPLSGSDGAPSSPASSSAKKTPSTASTNNGRTAGSRIKTG